MDLKLSDVKGSKVVEVKGTVSHEFGDPVFQLFSIVFEDGSEVYVGGEHDHPYVESDLPNLGKFVEPDEPEDDEAGR